MKDEGKAVPKATESPSDRLLAWYDRHARTLPWRVLPAERAAGNRADPYRIWLSEVMLQQTTVATVKAYYLKFLARWPVVEALAEAPAEEVMGAWAGLGYYARARNLHACAKAVVAEHGGRFPATEAGLKTLPGIGDYTAAAIAAIAFNKPAAVVDGNIERVVTRLRAIDTPLPAGKALVRTHVAALTPLLQPGDFAQAMMDLGATICTPRRPACVLCPLAEGCEARIHGTMELYPVKAAKKPKPARRGAAFVAVRPSDGAIFLRRRTETGMLGGMDEPPTTGWGVGQDGATGADAAPFAAAWAKTGSVVHVFTHFTLTLDVWRAEIASASGAAGRFVTPAELPAAALPTLMKKAIQLAEPAAFATSPSQRKRQA
ncbi:A/G-specific adenine glycosylase [Aureimonas sp. SA4125]|uniref:A/G-specific adenine glycosylase n=1 Tax=Aureimonas sp. SA4125 TaxID=2826993 RepID=UPI001CC3CB99|nr:A/G-specific adenine glycosylase [Aureimonas sp. SA4125]BDA83114.1 A/G-specific adenine glycosylase [Aureimonas sp. SA4125]